MARHRKAYVYDASGMKVSFADGKTVDLIGELVWEPDEPDGKGLPGHTPIRVEDRVKLIDGTIETVRVDGNGGTRAVAPDRN